VKSASPKQRRGDCSNRGGKKPGGGGANLKEERDQKSKIRKEGRCRRGDGGWKRPVLKNTFDMAGGENHTQKSALDYKLFISEKVGGGVWRQALRGKGRVSRARDSPQNRVAKIFVKKKR